MDCIQPGICNCISDCKCDNGYVCCSQKVPNGKTTYGMCVKQGFCDQERGIPIKSCRNEPLTMKKENDIREAYLFKENFESGEDKKKCKNWNNAIIMLTIISLSLLLLVLGTSFPRNL